MGQGQTQEEAEWDHDGKLKQSLNICRQKNIKVNLKKMTEAKRDIYLFVFDNKDYLILTVDNENKLGEIDYLADTKSTTVLKKVKAHFACQGIPDSVIFVNSPLYVSEELQKFNKQGRVSY